MRTLPAQRSDIASRIEEARAKRQGTRALLKYLHDLTVRELRANLRKRACK